MYRFGGGAGGGGPTPRAGLAGIGGLILLGGGIWAVNNALFNGETCLQQLASYRDLHRTRELCADSL